MAAQASRLTFTMFEPQTWAVGYMNFRNSQNLPSTPELAEVVTASMVPAASDGTTSPQGSWTAVMPTALKRAVVVLS